MKINRCVWGIFSFCLAAGILAWLVYSLPSTMPASAQDIADVNPVANAGPDRSVIVGAAVILDGSGSYDTDDDLPLSYLWAQTGGPTVTFNPTLSVTTFTAPGAPTLLTFTLAVTDSLGFADPTPDEVLVHVLGEPIANDDSGPAFTTDEDTPFITADVLDNDIDPSGSPLALQSFDTSGTLGQVSQAGPAGELDVDFFNPPYGYLASGITINDIVIQPDGKIVAAGTEGYGDYCHFALTRYNYDGSLDLSFGNNGLVVTEITGYQDQVYASAIQADGKIVVTGYATEDGYNYDFAMARYSPNGILDTTFGNNGIVIYDISQGDFNRALVIQPDGKIVLAGYSNTDFTLLRFDTDGTLDNTFGSNGVVTTDFGGNDYLQDVDYHNGKIYASGYSDWRLTDYDFILARYNLDGSLDTSFGWDGWVGNGYYYDDYGGSIAIQDDNRIVLAGSGKDGYDRNFAVMRFNPDGSMDPTFGVWGKVMTNIVPAEDDGVLDVAIQPDGKIVAVGYAYQGDYDVFAMARYNPDGSLDANFGNNGIITVDFGIETGANFLAIQADQKLLTGAGNILARYSGGSGEFNYNPNGQFDYLTGGESAIDTFSYVVTNGVLTDTATVSITITGLESPPVAVNDSGPGFTTNEDTAFITGDVLANDFDPEGQPLSVESFDTNGTLGQVTQAPLAGSLDTGGFKPPDGYVTVSFGFLGEDWVQGIAIQADGKIVVGGRVHTGDAGLDFALARYNPDGSLDFTFGENGIVTTDFYGNYDQIQDITIQTDNKIVAAGFASSSTTYLDFALARYNPDGSLDTTFGSGGKFTVDLNETDNVISAIVIQPDGKILGAGFVIDSDEDFALVRVNPDGNLDTAFGSSGMVTTDFTGIDIAVDVSLQSNGKIIAIGSTLDNNNVSKFALASYNTDGTPDISFGSNGQVTTDFLGYDDCHGSSIAIQPDGKIIAVGNADSENTGDVALARYNPNGSLDINFGNEGKITTDINGLFDNGYAIALQPDGKMVIGGCICFDSCDSMVMRYMQNGDIDISFGNDGFVISDFNEYDYITALALQPDGNILTVGINVLARFIGNSSSGAFYYNPIGPFDYLSSGEVATDTFTYVVSDGVMTNTATVSIPVIGVNDPPIALDDSGPAFTTDEGTPFITGKTTDNDQDIDGDKLFVSSFDASGTLGLVTYNGGNGGLPGSLDTTFGAPDGFVTTDFGGEDIANDLVLLPDGKFIVGGIGSSGLYYDFGLARYNPNGSLDTTFGDAGKVLTDFGGNEWLEMIAVQADGKIVAAGYTDWLEGYYDFVLARYNPDGTLDTTFGVDGKVATDFGSSDYCYALALQLDGKIIAAGYSWQPGTGNDFALVRYNSDGTLDNGFGSGGKVTTDFGFDEWATDMTIQTDGKILVAGNISTNNGDFAIARYNPNGSLDNTFGSGGMVTTDFGGGDWGYGLTIQPNDSKVVLAGATCIYTDCDFAVARYGTDGNLDPTFGEGGKVTTTFGIGVQGYDLAIQADHKIVVAGTSLDSEIYYDYVLARYNLDGSLDTTFGIDGKVTTDFFENQDNAKAIAIQPDGQILVAGGAWQNSHPGFDFTVARYNAGDGAFTYDPNGQFDYLQIGETATDTFTYVVSDGVLTDTATVSITVSGVNDSPLFISTPITTGVATAQYTYTVTTDDPDDSDVLTITGTTLPAWLNLTDHGDRSALLSGTPSTPGSFPVVLQVTDGIASASHAFTITVSESPTPHAADLSITQAFQWTSASSGVFTLTVTNLGPDEAPGAVVSDTFPVGFAGITWTCAGSGRAACSASGSGDIDDTLASFPAGGMVTYTILVGTIPAGEWTNTAEVIAPAGVADPDPANNRASVSFELVPVYLPVVGKP